MSYGIFTEANGSKPIIVHPDGTLCINYLDTNGAPLSNLHIDMASSLVCKLVGTTSDPEKSQLRKAQVRTYIQQLYDDYFAQWCTDHRNELPELTRLTIAAHRYKLFLPSDATFVEAWTELRHRLASNDDRAQTILSEITEAEISRWLKEPGTARTVRNCLFATFTPEQYPQHPDLHDMMQNHPMPEHDAREIADLATLLEPWNEQALVSGASTIRFTQNGIAHFELGQIPDANMHLKEIAAFLIANYARQHIITIPRSKRKLVFFEECARTLNIPGGQELVSEFYAQLSKFSTEIISSVQSYAMFRDSPIRPVVMGNAAIKFLCKFADRNDLDNIGTDIGLSESAKETIFRYPRPDHLPTSKAMGGRHLSSPGRAASRLRHDDQLHVSIGSLRLFIDWQGLRRTPARSAQLPEHHRRHHPRIPTHPNTLDTMIRHFSIVALALRAASLVSACDSMRSAAYAGGGAVAGGALAGGIGYAASKGNLQTTAISAVGGAVGGAILGGVYSGQQKSKKDKAQQEGYELGAVRYGQAAILDRSEPAKGRARRRREPLQDQILHLQHRARSAGQHQPRPIQRNLTSSRIAQYAQQTRTHRCRNSRSWKQ